MRTAILAFLLSGAILAQDQSEALIASLQKQIEINPEDFSPHANLGKLYCELQRYPEAVAELEKAAAIKPEAQSNLINLGGAYLGIGQTEPGGDSG
jgi:cytochrome c-type biogenesis protein CcmH/NrfG